MNNIEKISKALDNLNEKYIFEAYEYSPQKIRKKRHRKYMILAASILLFINLICLHPYEAKAFTAIYNYETKEKLVTNKMITLSGSINDQGEMVGHPLQFYVLGENIESIRFSCKKQWIEFADWTEKRENFGLSKNFTIYYGEKKDDYYYLVVNWVPDTLIRKLTDNRNITIEDLTAEDKNDIIVMEIAYMSGEIKTMAIKINLNESGQFEAYVCDYKITAEDTFVNASDNKSVKKEN